MAMTPDLLTLKDWIDLARPPSIFCTFLAKRDQTFESVWSGQNCLYDLKNPVRPFSRPTVNMC